MSPGKSKKNRKYSNVETHNIPDVKLLKLKNLKPGNTSLTIGKKIKIIPRMKTRLSNYIPCERMDAQKDYMNKR